ncbi:2Fe-2S iron-sulfur cluster-binding protein [Nocardia noduli]|uniref:2Fe-2S iron-sulfur cluster-binding protein n=1 Tax=Nocardia noduli TaxID=2815722 RepID=UPI001C221463|nr:2Fe-2S iron-sulfur cluster-binding protein [Nocardia noduli]
MRHPLTDRFDGAAAVIADIEQRVADTADHAGDTHRLIDAYHPKRLRLAISEIIEETETTKTFRLQAVDGAVLPPFAAGQYVNVFRDGTSRPYAISSSPANTDHYDLTVRRVPAGRISNLLNDTVRVDDEVVTTGPMGTFHHNPLFHGEDVVFLAGGSGVAPALSMLRDIADNRLGRRFHLLYGSRSGGDVLFRDRLAELVAEHPSLRVDHVISDPEPQWIGRTGFLSAETIEELAGPLAGRMVYVCGPQALYAYALEQLRALGHPRRRIRFEANGAPSDPAARSDWPADSDPAEEVTVTAGGLTFRSPRRRPLLDALEDNGIRPEAACRSGECSLCRIRVRRGQVHHAEEARLRLSDARFGYIHSCVAYPITDVELDL